MAFIDTIPPDEATGEVHDMYARQQGAWGFVPNYAKVFCHRPEVMSRWAMLLSAIRRPMTARRFELVTFAAARALKNSYCSLAHGSALAEHIGSAGITAIADGEAGSVLSDAERAIADFAELIARDASRVKASDVERLKAHGLGNDEIFDIAAAAAARSFFTKLLDALGAEPDSSFLEVENALRNRLVVGRPIAAAPEERVAPH